MSEDIKILYRTTLCVPNNCCILSVSFEGTELGSGSFIRLRDPKRPESFYDCYRLSNKVVFFPTAGSCVEIELCAAPRTSNRLQIQDIHFVNYNNDFMQADNCGICCGSDDRIPSVALFAGRLVLVLSNGSVSLCSAFLARYYGHDCILLFTAGHCLADGYDNNRSFIEFGDVPPSQWEGNRCRPVFTTDPEHIFRLGEWRFENEGVGRDWGVIVPGTNNEGLTPYQKYGERLTIHNDIGDHMYWWPIYSIGYGADDKPLQCERQYTQQLGQGRVAWVDNNIIWTAGVDIRPGSSGSPLIESFTNTAIGIITHCTPGCPNIAQRLDYWAIFSAYLQLCRCTGDIDNNRTVDDADLTAVLFRFGESCWFCPEDLNNDGIVDDGDLVIVLVNFGTQCP